MLSKTLQEVGSLTYTKIQCGIIIIIFFIEFIWIKFSSITFNYSIGFAGFQLILSLLFFLSYKLYQKFRPIPEIVILLRTAFVVFSYSPFALILTYLVTTTNQPYIDSSLASIDEYFFVYTPSIIFWFKDHNLWNLFFLLIYDTYYIQFAFVLLYFSFYREGIVLQRFVMQFMIASILTSLISNFFPAAGVYVWYDYTPSDLVVSALNHLQELRHNILDITKIDGIVSLPSFHAVMAFIYIYVFRNERKIIFLPILILNSLMIFSCLPIGFHYFADILGAVPVFLATIGIDQLIFKGVKKYGTLES